MTNAETANTTSFMLLPHEYEEKVQTILARGNKFIDQGNPERALAMYTASINIFGGLVHPKTLWLLGMNRAWCYNLMGMHADALEEYDALNDAALDLARML